MYIQSGSINGWCSGLYFLSQIKYTSADSRLGYFRYVTYNQTDFDVFGSMYDYNGVSAGYTKNNVTPNAHPQSRDWPIIMDALYQSTTSMHSLCFTVVLFAPIPTKRHNMYAIFLDTCDFYAHLKTVDSRPRKEYGAPADVWVRYTVTSSGTKQHNTHRLIGSI